MKKMYQVAVGVALLKDTHEEWQEVTNTTEFMATQFGLTGVSSGTSFGSWGTSEGHSIRDMQYETESREVAEQFMSWVTSNWMEDVECYVGMTTLRDGPLYTVLQGIANWFDRRGCIKPIDWFIEFQTRD